MPDGGDARKVASRTSPPTLAIEYMSGGRLHTHVVRLRSGALVRWCP
jgi:hypothetical protein